MQNKRRDTRFTRVCPVPGCTSRKKLSHNFIYKHSWLSHVQKQHYLRIARCLYKPKSKEVDVKQPALVEVLSCSRDQVQENEAEVEGEGEVEDGVDDATGYMEAPISATSEISSGTRLFPRF